MAVLFPTSIGQILRRALRRPFVHSPHPRTNWSAHQTSGRTHSLMIAHAGLVSDRLAVFGTYWSVGGRRSLTV